MIQKIELVCAIVNCGQGSRVIRIAKEQGVFGGTVMLGKGMGCNRFLNFIGLSEVKKEIVFMIAAGDVAEAALSAINEDFDMEFSNHGIVFTSPVGQVVGAHNMKHTEQEERGECSMYQAITIVVDKGKAEDVVNAAVKAGAKGGTIINGRGSGVHETEKLFNLEIEPEKEIVFILSRKDAADKIIESIRVNFHIDEPGKGIIYTQDVNQVYGIME